MRGTDRLTVVMLYNIYLFDFYINVKKQKNSKFSPQ